MLLYSVLEILGSGFYIFCVCFCVFQFGARVAPCLQCLMVALFVMHFRSGRCAPVMSSPPSSI